MSFFSSSSVVTENNKEPSQKCHNLYMTLVDIFDRKIDTNSTEFIKQLQQTQYCDQVKDLRELRNRVNESVGKDSLTRINQNKSTKSDVDKSTQTIITYNREIKSSLRWHLYYNRIRSFFT